MVALLDESQRLIAPPQDDEEGVKREERAGLALFQEAVPVLRELSANLSSLGLIIKGAHMKRMVFGAAMAAVLSIVAFSASADDCKIGGKDCSSPVPLSELKKKYIEMESSTANTEDKAAPMQCAKAGEYCYVSNDCCGNLFCLGGADMHRCRAIGQ